MALQLSEDSLIWSLSNSRSPFASGSMLQKVDLGIKFTLNGRPNLDIEICNNSPFPICLGGAIKFVEANCTITFEAAKRCGVDANHRSGQSVSTMSGHTIRLAVATDSVDSCRPTL